MKELIWKDKKLCSCICHVEGLNTMHMMPCCNLTYLKYLDKDKNLIDEKLAEIFKDEE